MNCWQVKIRRGNQFFLPVVGIGVLVWFMGQGEVRGQAALPAQSGGLTLEECINLGMENQPALAAARASLDAAETSSRGLQNLRLAGLFSRELGIRKQQSCLGIAIAEAGLQQAEWETRYAVTRNFFTTIYAREQKEVLDSVLVKLRQSRENAARMVEAGDPKSKVTQIDVDGLDVQINFIEVRLAEAVVGIQRARAALREAIGITKDFPLNLAKKIKMPDPVYQLDRNQLVAQGLERRGEMAQANSAHQVTELEIAAQQGSRKMQTQTFAAAGDVHAKPIPQGISNGEYRPGAIGLEMPAFMVGKKADRVARAQAFHDRAGAVIDKTQNLITLEVEAAYFKWKEAIEKIRRLDKTTGLAKKIADNVTKRFNQGKASGEEMVRARTLEDQAQGLYNEALYNHALALAALERVTAGGYRPTYAAKGRP